MAGHLIRRLHQISTQTFMAHIRDAGFGVTQVQFAAMEAIRENAGVDQASVAALIGYDRATIGGVIDRLVSKGYVARSVSKLDRRARVLHLTDEGARQFEALLPLVRALQDDILGRLNPEERATFCALARKSIGDDRL